MKFIRDGKLLFPLSSATCIKLEDNEVAIEWDGRGTFVYFSGFSGSEFEQFILSDEVIFVYDD